MYRTRAPSTDPLRVLQQLQLHRGWRTVCRAALRCGGPAGQPPAGGGQQGHPGAAEGQVLRDPLLEVLEQHPQEPLPHAGRLGG